MIDRDVYGRVRGGQAPRRGDGAYTTAHDGDLAGCLLGRRDEPRRGLLRSSVSSLFRSGRDGGDAGLIPRRPVFLEVFRERKGPVSLHAIRSSGCKIAGPVALERARTVGHAGQEIPNDLALHRAVGERRGVQVPPETRRLHEPSAFCDTLGCCSKCVMVSRASAVTTVGLSAIEVRA